uniref:Glycosyl transferase family 1 domain-containing protein n=1 Tax=Tetraselmis sp. GSL018 TaxID=582737 RepID=A0A061S9I6_9CHLO
MFRRRSDKDVQKQGAAIVKTSHVLSCLTFALACLVTWSFSKLYALRFSYENLGSGIGIRSTVSEQKTLVVYVYWEKDEIYKENLEFFLRHGVKETQTVDYLFVVNGHHTVVFPEYYNLKVLVRKNKCFDFGSWFVGLQTVSSHDYAFYFFINTSVRGPFLPSYFPSDMTWLDIFTGKFSETVKLVGLTINCPDGVGRRVPHVQSMFFVLDKVSLHIALKTGAFRCAASKQQSLYSEGAISQAILKSGYNIDVVQQKYAGVDWQEQMKLPNPCEGITRDIFLGPGMYDGMTAHPMEMVFMKVNRPGFMELVNQYSEWADIEAEYEGTIDPRIKKAKEEAAKHTPVSVKLVTRSLSFGMDDQMLFDLANHLQETGDFAVTVLALSAGDQRGEWEGTGSTVRVLSRDAAKEITKEMETADAVLFGTLDLPAGFVESLEPHHWKRIAWNIGEADPRRHPVPVELVIQKAARVIFPSRSLSVTLSKLDYGNFRTILSWTGTKVKAERGAARQAHGIDGAAFVVSCMGPLSPSNDQISLVRAVDTAISREPELQGKLRVLLVGRDGSFPGYESEVEATVDSHRLTDVVTILPPPDRDWPILADTDLFVSMSNHTAPQLSAVRAMAAGVPTVSVSGCGVGEMVLNRVDGFLVPPGDSYTLGSLIVEAFNSTRGASAGDKACKQVAQAGKETAKKRFSRVRGVRQYEELLRGIHKDWKEPDAENPLSNGKTCIVVRTFHEHGSGLFDLESMLRSLKAQENGNWEAIISVTDTNPFPNLMRIIDNVDDLRLRYVHLGSRFYDHNMSAYDLTDELISHCSPDASWLLVTNGDNRYLPQFLNHTDTDFDLIAYDWYTRYMYINDPETRGELCTRWHWGQCKVNIVRYWHTDLGANLLNLRRWRREDRLFHVLPSDAAQDSRMMEILIREGWYVNHVHDCLYHHSPNPILCHELGGVWFETKHQCITPEAGDALIAEGYIRYTAHKLPFTCIQH